MLYKSFYFLFLFLASVPAFCTDVFVTYYPFRTIPKHSERVRPLPEVQYWSEERMGRDLSRMAESGMTGIMLGLSPKDLANQHRATMVKTFHQMAFQQKMHVTLLFSDDNHLELNRLNVIGFLKRTGLLDHQACYMHKGHPFVFYDESMHFVENGDGNSLFVELSSYPKVKDGTALLSSDLSIDSLDASKGLPLNAKIIQLFAGTWPSALRTEATEKQRKESFYKLLDTHRAQSPDLIVVSSWNDYRNGNTLEPCTVGN